MILQLDDWTFDIDIEKTQSYSTLEQAEHCNCAYCRNFYAGIDEKYPLLRPFLAKFGIHVDAPDQMSPLDISSRQIIYDPMYHVFGRILHQGSQTVIRVGIEIEPMAIDEDRFCLQIYDLQLPWLLEELYETGISDATAWNSPLQ